MIFLKKTMEHAMNLVDPVLAMAQNLYALCGEVKANGRQCGRLAQRVKTLEGVLKALKVQDLGRESGVLQQSLKELRVTLESAQEMLNNYASANFLSRFAKAHDLGEEFEMLSKQLDDSYQVISLALLVDQRQTTTEATPREEDEEDQGSDRGELETLKEVHILEPQTREDFLKYSCQLTLDLNTAHRWLRLSDGNRKMTCVEQIQPYPDHQERFDTWTQVLCREGLSGRCYWEAEWSGEVSIAVSYKEIGRKGLGHDSVLGFNDKSWSLYNSPSVWGFRHNNAGTDLPVRPSSRIGVYLDHGAGILSFYNVSDPLTLLHRVQTTFTQPLYPGFWINFHDSSLKLCDLG